MDETKACRWMARIMKLNLSRRLNVCELNIGSKSIGISVDSLFFVRLDFVWLGDVI